MSRRWRMLNCDGQVVIDILKGHPMSRLTSDMPEDAIFVDAHFKYDTRRLFITVWSKTFDEVSNGSVIPVWTPTFKSEISHEANVFDLMAEKMREGA